MVGDGLNDVLAMKQARVGVAVGQSHSSFQDAADVVLARRFAFVAMIVFEVPSHVSW